MFKNKNQVDLHVQNIFKRCNETERNLRSYHFAKLYKEVGDLESARRFIVRYLTAREDSADAHKLYGHILLGLKQKKKALAEFKCSLELDQYQYELLPKVCHILSELDEPLDLDRAQFWVDRTRAHFPNHSAVFKLREKIVSERDKQNNANSTYKGSDELEALIAAELAVRPRDVPLRVRLLQLYLRTGRVKDAYKHATLSEAKGAYRNDLRWYECLADVFEASQANKNDWEFVAGNLNILERLSALSLEEYPIIDSGITRRSNVDCAKILQSFDKALHSASQLEFVSSEREFFHEFLKHMRGQLVLHLATLIFRKAKADTSSWREASKAAGALLLLAVGFGGDAPPDPQPPWAIRLSEARRKEVARWAVETSFRVSQAGHILMGMSRDRGLHFLDQIGQFCKGAWRERVYQRAIGTFYDKNAENLSHFLQFQSFAHPSLEIPSATDILPHDEMAQKLHPGSLHHMVWLGLESTHCAAAGNKRPFQIPPEFCCVVFHGLSLSNHAGGGSESLSQLDVDAFLYTTIYASAAVQEEWNNGISTTIDQQLPSCLPAALTDPLCTPAQSQWWSTAYQLLSGHLLSKSERKEDSKSDVGERRMTLQRGLEVIRAVGNHGLGPELSVKLARTFAKRAKMLSSSSSTTSNEIRALEERANLYWAAALPILERLARSQAVHYPQKRLFEYRGKPLSNAEVSSLLDEAHLAMAVKMMMEGKEEEAINAFQLLKAPEASYYQALIYKKLAAQEANGQTRDELTPEMKSRQVALFTKAKECLHLTQERLRLTDYDRSHPISIGVGKEMEDLEIKLERLNVSSWIEDENPVTLSMLKEETVDYSHQERQWSLQRNWRSGAGNGIVSDHRLHSTPVRSTSSRVENGTLARNISIEEHHQSHNETVRMLRDLKSWLAEEIGTLKKGMAEIKDQVVAVKEDVAKFKTSRHQIHHTSEVTRQATEGRDAEEDIYVYEDEYGEGEEVNIAAAAASAAAAAAAAAVAASAQGDKYGAYPGTGYPYQGYPTYRQMSGVQGAATVTYGAPSSSVQPPPPAALLPPSIAPFFPLSGAGVDPSLLPPSAAGMYHSSLRYYGQGALPFRCEGQQLPDFRGDSRSLSGAPLRQPLMAPGLGGHPDGDRGTPPFHSLGADPGYLIDKHMAGPPAPALPENVVITSSDTLPTSAPPNQPQLSVVIPSRHRLGTPATAAQPVKLPMDTMMGSAATSVITSTATTTAPHAFQITMPPQAQIPTQPPLDKSVSSIPPLETEKLLSSVPSPLHSAVTGDKTTKSSRPSASPKTRTSRKSLGEEDEDGGDEGDSVEHDPYPDFQPVIPLPAVVETHTGEEEETLLFSSRAKLYRFVDREWKERGIGIIKILHNQSTGKARIIMRREQVFKVCANHFITPDMGLSPVAGSKGLAWLWGANDFADEEVRIEKLSARFKTSVEAEGFREAFEKARKIVSEATPDKCSSEDEKGGKEKIDKVVVLTSDSQKTLTTAAGSQKVTSTMEVKKVTPTTPQVTEISSSASAPAENIKVILDGFTFVSPPTLKQVDDDKKKSEEKQAAKPNIFASFSFGQTPAPLSGGITWGKPALGVAATPDSSAKESAKPVQTGEQTPFDNPSLSKVSFASLASDADKKETASLKSDSTTKTPEAASKLAFGSSPVSTKKGDGDAEEGDFMPTVEFKPVIPLPQLVEVKTGEEGEEVLFEHRAKLLRYGNKEWIEFGIGQMKITLNPTTAKVRLIMRREQVLKVCCNHFLTEDMQFMPLKTSDRCWTWHAQDYADGNLTPKTLAIKFKASEEAMKFKSVLDDLQKDMVDGKAKLDKIATSSKDKESESADSSGSCKGNLEKLSELFKPEAGSWECKECYIRNKGDTKSCVACNTVRPGFVDNSAKEDEKSSFSPFKFGISPQVTPSSQVQAPTPAYTFGVQPTFTPAQSVSFKFGSSSSCDSQTPSGFVASAETSKAAPPQTKKAEAMPSLASLFKPEEGSWECKSCYVRNKNDITKCISCSTQKPGTVATADVTSGQVPPQTTFKFGIPTATADSQSAAKKTEPPKPAPSQTKKAEAMPSLASLFKPEEGSWECKDCYLHNKNDITKCIACSTQKPGTVATADVTPPKGVVAVSKSSEGFGSLAASFKQKEGSWECKFCYVYNIKDLIKCKACGEMKPDQVEVPTTTASQASVQSAFRFGIQPDTAAESKPPAAATTAFTFCTTTVPAVGKAAGDAWAPAKFTFGGPQPSTGTTLPSATPLFGQPLTSFTFGATTTGPKPMEEKVADPSTGFTFASNQKYEFNFKGIDPKASTLATSPSNKGSYFKSPDRQISHDESAGSDLYQEDDDGDHIHFQPVIPLPDKVPLHTGEEAEEVLYQHRAKLYRWNNKEWKERGCGDIKLLKHFEDGRVRMVMRREHVLKLCLNHYVSDEVSLTPKGDRAWQWTAVDFSEGEGTPELFSLRFKSSEIALAFKDAFDDAKAGVGKPRESTEGGNKTPTPRTPTSTPQTGYPINKSPAMQAFSFKLGSDVATPPNTSRFSLESLFGSTSSANDTKSTISTPHSPSEGITSSEVEVVFERKTSEEDRQAALKLMLPPNFYAYRDLPPCPGCRGCDDYDQEKLDRLFAKVVKEKSKTESVEKEGQETKVKEEITPTAVVTSTVTSSDSPASVGQSVDDSKTETDDYGLPFLKVDSSLSFASLAAATSTQSGFTAPTKTTVSPWGGAIAPIFRSGKKSGTEGEGGESDGEGGTVETNDPHFEPIIPLPALITVRTGEEEETKVFEERAKLYRFDSKAKEWKERGVGEMKILFHPVNHTYRFLMRRELVHKLVLNHLITADFELKEIKNSDKSYVWYATNYAEDTPELEQLCARFKNQDLAKRFAAIVKFCVENITSHQASKSLQNISGLESDVSQTSTQLEEEEHEEEDDEDDDDDYEEVDDEDLERRTIFDKRGKLDVRERDEWKTIGVGDIRVIYEPEFLGALITLETSGIIKCNALITTLNTVKAKDKICEYSADELSHDTAVTRRYRVQFSSDLAASEFETAFKQGMSIALDPHHEEEQK